MTNGSDASIQNWHLETPRSVAADVGLDDVIASMGQQGTNTTWAGASWENFRPKTQVMPTSSLGPPLALPGDGRETTAAVQSV